MELAFRRKVLAMVSAVLAAGLACKSPKTALRERPVQRIELVQRVQGMTATEETALLARLGEGLGVPAIPSAQSDSGDRIFRLTLTGGPNPNADRGLAAYWMLNTGTGFCVGGLLASGVPAFVFTSLKVTAIGAGLGTLLGFGYGPIGYKELGRIKQEKGYIPWKLLADWEIVHRGPAGKDTEVASRRHYLEGQWKQFDLVPHSRPLPVNRRGEDEVRQASLEAFSAALLQHLNSGK